MKKEIPKEKIERQIRPDGSFNLERIGLKRTPGGDLYHFLLVSSWPQCLGLLIGTYLVSNLIFAVIYGFDPQGISNLEPANLWGRFFFSIQTMSTVGYGGMAPYSGFAHSIMVIQSLYGFLLTAVSTGLIFAKFSKVSARVLYSKNILMHRLGSENVLTFRAANERSVNIVDARVKLVLAQDEVTAEGQAFRRIYDLELKRKTSPLFALLWNVYHVITPESPLFGCTPEELASKNIVLMISLQGVDDALGQLTHSRHAYQWNDIVFNQRFVDVIGAQPNGKRFVDYRTFHDFTEPIHLLTWNENEPLQRS